MADFGRSENLAMAIDGLGAFGDETIEYIRPSLSRARILAATLSISKGISGIRMAWALPEMPACRAIHPA
jgi:hypothetical protein